MPWERFEKLAVDTVRRLYGRYGISVEETSLVHDGGRDAEAHHVLAVGIGDDMSIVIKVFLEVKSRSTRSVDKTDVGSHLIDAFSQKVTKVIFVTNFRFTDTLYNWIRDFCAPLNIQYSLISGERLIELLAEAESPSPSPPECESLVAPGLHSPLDHRCVTGTVTYTLDPCDSVSSQAKCVVRNDRPVYALVDIHVGEGVSSFKTTLEMHSVELGAAEIYCQQYCAKEPVLLSPGERIRWVFAIWPKRCGNWGGESFSFVLRGFSGRALFSSTNYFQVSERGLTPSMVGSHVRIRRDLDEALNAWANLNNTALRVLMAPGGAGKSFLVGGLRRDIQAMGMRELVLDGETIFSDSVLLSRTFTALFPFPKKPFEESFKPALLRWLETLGLAPEIGELIAQDLCGAGRLQADGYNPTVRAQLMATLLAEASRCRGLLFVFEDLHKVAPSVLSLLGDVFSRLHSTGQGSVFFLLTSRPSSIGKCRDHAVEWLGRLQKISALAEDALLYLEPMSESEAGELLQLTAPTLSAPQIKRIIQQIGTTPFNLREAMLYLLQLGLLEDLGGGISPVLTDPIKLWRLIEHSGLRSSTKQRLEVFFRDQPTWLRSMLEAGACYGRQFPSCETARAAMIPTGLEHHDFLEDCARWSIAAPSPERYDSIEFDHDLVRVAVLEQLPGTRQRHLADKLLSELAVNDNLGILAALAYQAGRADDAFNFSRSAAAEARKCGRPVDALKANYIALLMVDPAWAGHHQSDGTWGDIAIQLAPPTRRQFKGWKERDQEALSILLDNLHSLGAVTSGSSGVSDSILTEAQIVASRIGDHGCRASLTAMEGRMLFERNQLSDALARHEDAERTFEKLGFTPSAERAENLIRLAICLRQNGQLEDSVAALGRALKHRPKKAWTLLNKVRSNLGALYLRSDWDKVRYHWERQLRSARVNKLFSRQAHALAGLSFVNLFDGRIAEGRRQAEEALSLAQQLGMDNTILRCDLNLSVAWLIEGNPDAALQCLMEAEHIAIQHNIGRRLWRVYANLATTWELLGQSEKALACDLQALISLGATSWEPESLDRRSKELMPLLNIISRSELAPNIYAPLLARLSTTAIDVIRELAASLNSDNSRLSQSVGKYRIQFNGIARFLVTE